MDGIGKKRPLDDDDDDDDRLNKRKRYDCNRLLHLQLDDDIPKVSDEKKWNSLPGIVYELLSLFKKGDKTNATTIVNKDDDKTKHTNSSLGVEENILCNVLPNQNQEANKLLNIANENNNNNPIQDCVGPQNTTELDSAIKNYSQNLEELDYMINGTVTVFGPAKSKPVKNIKKNVVEKTISAGVKEEKLNVLLNQNCGDVNIYSSDVKHLIDVESNKKNLSFKEEIDIAKQKLRKIDCYINGTENVQIKISMDSKSTTSRENIKNNDVKKKNISAVVKEEKLNVLQNQNCGVVENSSSDVKHLIAVESNKKNFSLKEELNTAKQKLRKTDCFIDGTKTVQTKLSLDNKLSTSVENKNKNDVEKANQKEDGSNKKKSIVEKSTKNVPENSAQKDNKLYPKHLLLLPKKEHLLTLLKIQCLNGISESNQPISKPPPCNCVFCMKVDNLPTDQYMVNNLYSSNNGSKLHYNYENCSVIHSDMYNSNLAASDCSVCASQGIFTTNNCFCANQSSSKHSSDKKPLITPKKDWVDNLKHLIKKNEETFKVPETTSKSSKSSLEPKKNAIRKVYNTAKRVIGALCDFCKHSKYSCRCYRKNRDYNGMSFGYHGNYRSSRY